MPQPNQTIAPRVGGDQPPATGNRRMIYFAASVALLIAAFARPLYRLFEFSRHSTLFSHIALIPAISGYFIWLSRRDWPPRTGGSRHLTSALAFLAFVVIGAYWYVLSVDYDLPKEDALFLTTLSFLLFLVAICSWAFGQNFLRHTAFPLAFLGLRCRFPSH
jgi:hypothetical protein